MNNLINSKVFGGIMLIAGTSIGAAMLAMPITTGLFGFLGTLVTLVLCWLFAYWMACLILEASLSFKEEVSFYSMAKNTLGPLGAFITWLTFLLLFYALLSAYLTGSGKIIIESLESIFGISLPPFFDILPLLVLFAPCIYFGLSIVDQVNRLLMYAMFLVFAIIIFWLLPNVSIDYLSHVDFSFSLISFSLIITAFGYHVLIPSLVHYLDRDVKQIKICLFYGSFIPLVVYTLWELVMLGSIPVVEEWGFLNALNMDIPLTKLLSYNLGNESLAHLARAFSIFAVITSFLGVAQGLFDFLQDAISQKANKNKKICAFILTFLPPVLFILFFQKGFITLLEYAGALVAIILGIIPILVVWQLRKNQEKPTYKAPGNGFALIFGLLFFIFIIGLVLFRNLG